MAFVAGTPIAGAAASGSYIDIGDIQNIFGDYNVITWSNLDGSSVTADNGRIQKAIDFAEDKINSIFRNSKYVIPFAPAPDIVIKWAATLAGLWLFDQRGRRQKDKEGYKYADVKKEIYQEMQAALSGRMQLNATLKNDGAPTAPHIVSEN